MKIKIIFGNPFLVMIYTASMLAIGWAIGSHYGHSLTSGWMLLFAITFLLLHDACIAVLLAIAATRISIVSKD